MLLKSISKLPLFLFPLIILLSCKVEIQYKESISLKALPDKTEYFTGETIDYSGLIVSKVKEDGTEEEITDYVIEPAAETVLSEEGKTKVTITYNSCQADFEITVKKIETTDIYLNSIPQTAYYAGEKFNIEGLELVVLKNNGTKEIVTDFTSEPERGTVLEATESGKQTVTLTYDSHTYSFEISVYPVELEELNIKEMPEILTYYTNDMLDLTGLVVEGIFNDGTVLEITDYTTEPENLFVLSEKGNKTVKIKYLEKETDFDINVEESIFKFIKETEKISFPLYSENQSIEFNIFADGKGKLNYEFYRKNPGEEEFTMLETTETEEVDFGELYSKVFDLPQNNYVTAEYFCRANLCKGITTKTVNSDICTVEQTIDTGLALLKINTKDGLAVTSKEEYKKASFDLVSKDYDELALDEIKIKGRGNTSWGMPKKSYTLKLSDKSSVLGMSENKKWVLIANYSDKSLLRNAYASYLGNEICTNMEWNPSFESVDFVFNNEYMGTYLIGEQIKIDENRVNIQNVADTVAGKGEDLNEDGIVDEKDGGFIFEVNKNRMDEAYNYRTNNGIGMSLKDPDVEDFLDYEEKVESYMSEIIQNTENILYSDDWLDSENGYNKYLDVDSFIDWWLVNEFTKNNDSRWFSSVYIYYNPKTCKIYMGPNWDFDISCGNIDYSDCYTYEGFWIISSGWHGKLFSDEEFIVKVKNRWNQIKEQLYLKIDSEILTMSYEINNSAELNFVRWPILGTYVWPNANGYEERKTYESEVEYMIEWLQNRYSWMNSAIQSL